MALTNVLELQSGSDQRLRLGLWLVWLAALLSVAVHAQRMPLLLLLISAVLLLLALPGFKSPALKHQRLQLHADGKIIYEHFQGRWHSRIWRSPWYTVIRIETGQQKWSACISSANNSADVYRRLGIWCRYSPQEIAPDTSRKSAQSS